MRKEGGEIVKPLVISLAALAAILTFSLWSGHYVAGRTETWSSQLADADASARQERWADTLDQLHLAYADWGESQTFFHTIMEHEELDEAESLFAAAFAACDAQDAPDFHAAIAQLSSQLSLLAETQAVSIKNIL